MGYLFMLIPALVLTFLIVILIVVMVELAVRLNALCLPPVETERVIVGQIASIVRQNLPLAAGIALAAASERGRPAVLLRRVARLLAQGLPLAEAFRKAIPKSSALTQSLIAAGEKSGQMTAALNLAEENLADMSFRKRHKSLVVLPYLLVMTTATTLVTTGLMVAVIPKFKEIFQDFNTQLPGITVAMINASESFIQGQPPAWIPILAVVLIGVFLYLRPRRLEHPRLASRIADWLRWHTPFFRRVHFNREMKASLQVMRIATGSGMDLAVAARIAAETDVNLYLRQQLAEFAKLLESGTDLRKAIHAARLGEITGIALTSGQRGGDIDAGFRYAIDYYDAVVGRIMVVLRSLTVPLVVLIAAAFAGWLILAMYLPLVTLINSVSGSTW